MPAIPDLVARKLRGHFVSRHPLTVKSRSARVVHASLGPLPAPTSAPGGGRFALTAYGDISVE
ncbi:MAG: hypothetical protein HY906_02255 [Deltaproteobacteria bacterium]|nr:hypothetical protein [Deltaproteobacteria bacterium]